MLVNACYCFNIHKISKFEAIYFFEKFCTRRSWIYIKNIVLIFSLLEAVSILLFYFAIYKMVDGEDILDIYKSVKISIGAVMRSPEIFVLITLTLKNV